MGVRENKVETYLRSEMEKIGGITRKWKSPGRDGVPDQVVIWGGHIPLVEVKTTDGTYESSQEREHKRLRDAGATVVTVWGHVGVDKFVADLHNYDDLRYLKMEYR